MRVSIELYDEPRGRLLDDWTAVAVDPVIKSDEHGFWSFALSIPMALREGFEFYANSYRLWLVVSFGGRPIWEGRVEDVKLSAGLIDVTAYGAWNYLTDTLYTALWSDTGYGRWFLLTGDDNAGAGAARWEADNNNRLYAAPMKDEQFGNAAHVCTWAYAIPQNSERQIQEIEFSYSMKGPSGDWRMRVCRADGSWAANLTTIWQLESNGSVQSGTGSVDWSATPTDRLIVQMFYDAAGPTTYTGETGDDVYFKLTAVRVKSFTADELTADVVVQAQAASAASRGAPLATDAALISNPNVDLDDLVIEDKRPSETISELAAQGDDSTPPQSYESGVWEDGRVFFRPRIAADADAGDGDHMVWHLLVEDIEAERSIATLANSVYATYSGNGRTERLTDADSVALTGVQRDEMVNVSTSSAARAENVRAAKLVDTSDLESRAAIRIGAIMDTLGTDVPYWSVRSGDVAYLTNLPPGNRFLDGIRSFRIKTTEYNLATGELALTPSELPQLDVILAG
jgi:hypothetical protein